MSLSAHAADASNNATSTSTENNQLEEALDEVKAKLMHLLEVYPYISRAMIQTGLSPALPPKIWDPILQGAVDAGEICYVAIQSESPNGRTLTKGIYHLPRFPYPPVSLKEYEGLISAPSAA